MRASPLSQLSAQVIMEVSAQVTMEVSAHVAMEISAQVTMRCVHAVGVERTRRVDGVGPAVIRG